MNVLKMTDLDLKGKRVLIREDLNVPVKNGKVTSDVRIQASPPIKLAMDAGAKVMLMSHLAALKKASMTKSLHSPVAEHLGKLLGREVPVIRDWLQWC